MAQRGWAGNCLLFVQAEDGIRDLVRSRGLGDVYKRQVFAGARRLLAAGAISGVRGITQSQQIVAVVFHPAALARACMSADDKVELESHRSICLLYTSDAADERSSVDLGGRRIIKKKNRPRLRRLA